MSNPCSFPATQLLRLRRRIAETTTIPIEEQARLVKEIDEMRHDHFEASNCSCWEDARFATPSAHWPLPQFMPRPQVASVRPYRYTQRSAR